MLGILLLGLTSEDIKLTRNRICYVMEIDWMEVKITLNSNKINFPKSVTIKFQDKLKIRHPVKRAPFLFHLMLKKGFTWFTLASNKPPDTL